MPLPPWTSLTGLEPVVAGWLASGYVRPCLTADHALPPSPGSFVELPDTLPAPLAGALRARGIDRLYAHQAEAFAAARAGRHVVVATPTASGKSLCFHLPGAATRSPASPTRSALYLYPDQGARARPGGGPARADRRDAGSRIPRHRLRRRHARATRGARRASGARIVLTNPDMLHAGILPHHARWARTLPEASRYVVVDELHTYRGVFGSHMAHVLARLRRVGALSRLEPDVPLRRRRPSATRASTPRACSASRRGEVALVDESRRAARARAASSSTTRRS